MPLTLAGTATALSVALILAVAPARAGKLSVGYGLGIADFGGLIGHNGAIFGFSTAMVYVPAADATIAIGATRRPTSRMPPPRSPMLSPGN